MSLTIPTPTSVDTPARIRAGLHVAAGFLKAASALIDTLLSWNERRRQRRDLLELDEHILKDIGVTRLDAEWEARKPFWRA